MVSRQDSNKARKKRQKRVRAKISGTAACPRLNVYRSNSHIYAQLIDDVAGVTLASASTVEKDFTAGGTTGGNTGGGNEGGGESDGTAIYSNNYDKTAATKTYGSGSS